MLGKLIKHEFKATGRILGPLFLILLVLSVVNKLVLSVDLFKGALKVIPNFVTFTYLVSIIAVVVVTFVIVIIRFYKNLMTDEGYLMFTLPVKSRQLINSKLIISCIWTLLSLVAVIASLLIVFDNTEFSYFIKELFYLTKNEIDAAFGVSNTKILLIELIVLLLISIINRILTIYASIAIGQLFTGHRIIGAFGAYIAISTVIQIILIAILLLLGLISGISFDEMETIPQLIIPLTIIFNIISNFAFYFITDYIFQKKLNLE